ncbi:SDR family NAD(P)-dependent oxidoreductase [Novosphingobium sediminicola]|uniref:NAD(P)-dependent dehydrogenase (Short-subunit alcohol dehydrogenase family) n=1 Tax=Novosphingobium sediminicola TaxID=563162 RepID=A0A7W6CME0_9SPHN|nr:glucose 1-dehydrogenase [Novosphingobium sediminicola]MBB3957319.1 NAD(P)-dependent dehydrogenase (short-subunit alcohol dehydrogenase family) [Novosphingobium sediminicola]
MARLEGKVALVTGGASVPGLGSATAIRFAQEGARVYLTDRDLAGAEKVADGIRQSGGYAVALHHDVTSEADWDRVMAAVDEAEGRLDVLVNNAGIAVLGMMDTVSTADWQHQIDVNLTSVFQGARRAMAMMRRTGSDGKARGGAIINISSVAGLIGVPGCASYAASKGGVRLLTKVVALEGATEGIRCNSVHPGMIATNIQGVALEDNAANYDATMALIPMGYMGAPEDIANMNLFLASDEARYITGTEMVVDGGMTAR